MPIKSNIDDSLIGVLLAGVGFNNLTQIDQVTEIILNIALIGVALITAYKKLTK